MANSPYLTPDLLEGIGKPEPSFGDLLTSALLRESLPVRAYWEWSLNKGFEPVPGYDALKDERLKELPGHELPAFAFSASPEETEWILSRREADRQRARELDDAGLKGTAALMMGAMANVSPWLPGVSAATRVGSMVRTGALHGAGAGAEQLALSSLDTTRRPEEIALSALLSGATGLAVGSLVVKSGGRNARFNQAMDDFEAGRAADEPPPHFARNTDGTAYDPETGEVWTPPLNAAERQSVGAAAVRAPRMDEDILDDLTPKDAFGVEKLRINPVLGLLNSAEPAARELVEELAEIPVFLRQDAKGIARAENVEGRMRPYRTMVADAARELEDEWLLERIGRTGTGVDVLRLKVSDLIGRTQGRTLDDFLSEVGKAMRRNDQSADPAVARAARSLRAKFDVLAKEAADVGAFEEVQRKRQAVVRLRDELGAFADLPVPKATDQQQWSPRVVEMRDQLDRVMTELKALEGKIPEVTTADSYFRRVWNQREVRQREQELEDILTKHFEKTGEAKGARERAKEAIHGIKHDDPFQQIDDADVTGMAGGLHSRTLEVPDELVEDFLESNALAVFANHARTLAGDIEIVRHENARSGGFGLINMHHSRREIENAWNARIAKEQDKDLREALKAQKKADLDRVVGLRDRIRGTVGLTQDPWSLNARAIRLAKQTMTTLYMGGAALTATIDFARPIMTEGLSRTLESGYKPLLSEAGRAAARMSRTEARMAGTAFGNELALRAAMLVDTGDVASRYSRGEAMMSKMADAMFVVNGLNWVDQSARTVASQIVMTRILDDAAKWGRGTLDTDGVEKLARAGIDKPMAERIAAMSEKHATRMDGVHVANTATWEDIDAAAAFRRALGEDIDRTVPLVGIGDKPLFMSEPLWSLITQFRSFGFAALMRTTIPMLQQRDRNAFVGVAMMTAMGGIVNEIRDVLNDKKTERTTGERIARAVDRAGIAGIAGDIGGAIDRISEQGAQGAFETLGGPAASAASDLGTVLHGMAFGNGFDPQAAHAARRILPYNTLVYFDGLFDAVERGMAR